MPKMPCSGELGIDQELFDELMETIGTARFVHRWSTEIDLDSSAREYLEEVVKLRRETVKHMDALTKISNDDQANLVLNRSLIDLFSEQFPIISKIILEKIIQKPDGRRSNFCRNEFLLRVDCLFTEATGRIIKFDNADPYGVGFQFLDASRSGLPDLEDLKPLALGTAFRRAVTAKSRKQFLEYGGAPFLSSSRPSEWGL